VDVEAPVSAIEAALAVKINSYAIGGASYYSNDRNPVVPAALGSIVHSVGGLNNIQAMKPGNHGLPEPEFPVYSPGPAYAVGEDGGHDGDRTKLGGAIPGFTNGVYDPTDLWFSAAYDVQALYIMGHCCNPLGNPQRSPKETSIAIATAGLQLDDDIIGFYNTYFPLTGDYSKMYVDGTPVCCDAEGTLDEEYASAMANSKFSLADTAWVYLYDGVNDNSSTFTDVYNRILSDNLARVFSTGWGGAEFTSIAQSVMDTDHGIFNSMIGQGWTLVASAGDWGATSWGGSGCTLQDAVTYPGSDPDVVSAGGSSLQLSPGQIYDPPIFDDELAWSGGADGCSANDGGSGGGASAYYAAPSYMALPSGSKRPVPDIALNADWLYHPQNYYLYGSLTGTGGGTGMVAAEVAGFFAQANAYLLYIGSLTGGCSGVPCAPLGNGDWYLYFFGLQPHLAPHYPFYDITSGCNNNDVTIANHLNFFCAGPGRDQVTGWGSFNFLQLAWAINFDVAGDFGTPSINFTGPALNKWYNTSQTVSWTILDTTGNSKPPTGVAGFSEAWDTDPGGGDPSSEATPGYGNSFYDGPQWQNQDYGSDGLPNSQGWHRLNVRAWDNTGIPAYNTYGPIGYDSVPPQTTGQASTTNPVQITLTATDASSGVARTVYKLDGGPMTTYAGPFLVSGVGDHALAFLSTDHAGNVETTERLGFAVAPSTTTAVTSSVNPSQFLQAVTFTATVSAASGTPAGTVTFFAATGAGPVPMGASTLKAGKAELLSSSLGAGGQSITASYAGSGKFAASTSPVLTQTVVKAATTTTLTSSMNPSNTFSAVTFTAKVTGAFRGSPTGTVSFMNGTQVLGTGTVSASTNLATFVAGPGSLNPGTWPIQAVYGGDSNFSTSKSPVLEQVVNF
jgi:hypothetical protein